MFFCQQWYRFRGIIGCFFLLKEQRPHQMKGKCSSHQLSTWCDHTNCKSLYCICVSFKFYAVLMKCHVISSKIDFLNVISIPVYLRGLPLAFFLFDCGFHWNIFARIKEKKAIRFDVSVECANIQASMKANDMILMWISEGWNNLGFIIFFRLNDLDFFPSFDKNSNICWILLIKKNE